MALDLVEAQDELSRDGPVGGFILRDIEAAPDCFGIEYKTESDTLAGALIEVCSYLQCLTDSWLSRLSVVLGLITVRLTTHRPIPKGQPAGLEGSMMRMKSFKQFGSSSLTTPGDLTKYLG